jgi:hypothetical protein
MKNSIHHGLSPSSTHQTEAPALLSPSPTESFFSQGSPSARPAVGPESRPQTASSDAHVCREVMR